MSWAELQNPMTAHLTTGNPPYIAALQNLDGDMPQYISDNTDDELSHAAFLNAYLKISRRRGGKS